jgi:hypothetical protein
MKRVLILLIMLLSLSGCGNNRSSLEPAMELRQKITKGNGCTFDTEITADYVDKLYTFRMHCESDANGNMTFSVVSPDSIAGIQGSLSSNGGQLKFEDQILAFSMLADGQITPVSAPWIFIQALEGGYIRGCEAGKDSTHIIVDDTYKQSNLQVDIYLSADGSPVQGDILWGGRRILTVEVENFRIL